MEAIIYNMSTYIEPTSPFVFTPEIHNHSSDGYHALSAYVYRRLTTAVYHLQYSAVSSQIGRHELAIESAKTCLNLLRETLTEECSYESFLSHKTNKKSKMRKLLFRSRGIEQSIIADFIP